MRACKLLGHSYRFTADGETMRWECERGCGDAGSKRYASAAEAQRYARAFDRRDADQTGKRPLLSLLPLWLARKAGERSGSRSPSKNPATPGAAVDTSPDHHPNPRKS